MLLSYTASPADEGRKVYSILRNELRLSQSIIKRLKNAQAIYVNGEKAYTTFSVRPGDVVAADILAAEREADLVPEDGPIDILFENNAFVVLNKPCGMIVHPSRAKLAGSLAALCAGYFVRTGQDAQCHVVNRLDRDTSGAVIMAKSAHYKTLLSEALASPEAGKRYIALVCGVPRPEKGVIDAPIRRAEPQKMRRIVAEDGHRAVTHYEVAGSQAVGGEDVSLVRFRLETGRTHQIRVHAAYIGCPLLGDALYGSGESQALSAALGITAQALHAESITLRDPLSGERITVTAPIRRADMIELIDSIRKEQQHGGEESRNTH